jgi:hypothetical protein
VILSDSTTTTRWFVLDAENIHSAISTSCEANTSPESTTGVSHIPDRHCLCATWKEVPFDDKAVRVQLAAVISVQRGAPVCIFVFDDPRFGRSVCEDFSPQFRTRLIVNSEFTGSFFRRISLNFHDRCARADDCRTTCTTWQRNGINHSGGEFNDGPQQ